MKALYVPAQKKSLDYEDVRQRLISDARVEPISPHPDQSERDYYHVYPTGASLVVLNIGEGRRFSQGIESPFRIIGTEKVIKLTKNLLEEIFGFELALSRVIGR